MELGKLAGRYYLEFNDLVPARSFELWFFSERLLVPGNNIELV